MWRDIPKIKDQPQKLNYVWSMYSFWCAWYKWKRAFVNRAGKNAVFRQWNAYFERKYIMITFYQYRSALWFFHFTSSAWHFFHFILFYFDIFVLYLTRIFVRVGNHESGAYTFSTFVYIHNLKSSSFKSSNYHNLVIDSLYLI